MAPRILISACEPSADRYAANVVRELRALCPEAEVFGAGSQALSQAGASVICDGQALAVTGLFEAFSKLGTALWMLRHLEAAARERRPDAALLLDSPDFNLRLAGRLKRLGIPVIYYICPQVWAWRRGRVRLIRKVVDRMFVIFPFEEKLLASEGVEAEFVGHPLLEIAPLPLGAEERQDTIGLLPGSRLNEVRRHLGPMLCAAEEVAARHPDFRFVIPVAAVLDRQLFLEALKDRKIQAEVTEKPVFDALRHARAAVTASGTASVELALLGVPMVIVYRMNPLSYLAGRLLVKVRHIGMVNILSGKEVAKELIQQSATAENIAVELSAIIEDNARYPARVAELARLREMLGNSGASRRVAEEVLRACNG